MSAASGHARPTLSKSIFATDCPDAEVTKNITNAAAASRKTPFLIVGSPRRAGQ
jgi:hypothetical protein